MHPNSISCLSHQWRREGGNQAHLDQQQSFFWNNNWQHARGREHNLPPDKFPSSTQTNFGNYIGSSSRPDYHHSCNYFTSNSTSTNQTSHDYDISGLNQDNYDNYDDYYDSYDTHESYHGRREEKLAKKTKKYCDTCNCECTGEQAYEAHLNGKNHKKKAATTSAQKIPLKALARGRAAYHCEVCNIDCTGADVYQAHVNGQKHQRTIKTLMKANKPIPSIEIPLIFPNDDDTNNEKPIINKKRKAVESDLNKNSNALPLGLATPEFINDRHIMDKIEQIELNQDQYIAVEELVLIVEETLYNVSAMLEAKHMEGNQHTSNLPSSRLLRGIMRVGLLANQLLLKSDRRADLVVLCSVIPTKNLLCEVTRLFRQVINKNEQDFNIIEVFNDSAFSITCNRIPICIFVTLTCSSMRQWSPGDLNYYAYVEPLDALPKIPCLYALAEMRRTKFYQMKCEPYPSMNCIVKIVRDFGKRIPAWSPLSNWIIVLIVLRAFSLHSAEDELGPSASLKALFSAISDGHLLGPDSILMDPCEKLPTNAIATLSTVERNRIFASVRYSLRQINTNNMAKLLALEGTGIPSSQMSSLAKKNRYEFMDGIKDGDAKNKNILENEYADQEREG